MGVGGFVPNICAQWARDQINHQYVRKTDALYGIAYGLEYGLPTSSMIQDLKHVGRRCEKYKAPSPVFRCHDPKK